MAVCVPFRVAVVQDDSESSEVDLPLRAGRSEPAGDHAPNRTLSLDQLEEQRREYQEQVSMHTLQQRRHSHGMVQTKLLVTVFIMGQNP